ncbi:apolipoprotein N-acyltransferase [Candidatus Desantisbacteria bacterium]|nr:apolipoprotein N-acyltransferase [Candidatus Desantisbacteria bacterium]
MQVSKIRNWIISANPFILAGVSGLLLALCFPDFNFPNLSWIALIPLIIAVEKASPRKGFWLGYMQGIIFTLASMFWIRIFHFLALPGMLLVFSLYFGLFAWLYVLMKKHFPFLRHLLAALLWTSIEYIRGLGFLGLTWNSLAYTQYKNIYLIQIADITGIAGITFLIVLTNVYLADFLILDKPRIKSLWLCLMLILLALIYGKFSIPEKIMTDNKKESTISTAKNVKTLEAGIIQGNFDVNITYDYEKIGHLKKLSSSLSGADLIVWTETVLLNNIVTSNSLKSDINEIAYNNNSFILLGNPSSDIILNQVKDFNSAYLLDPKGLIIDRYDKIHLVPFGEAFPLRNRFEFIKQMESRVDCGGFESGKRITIFKMGKGKSGTSFAVLICFEGTFGDLTRKFVKKGAEFLVNITNDSWSKSSTSHHQHANISIFRAVENHVYLIRAANTGVSCIIDPYGRILKKLEIYKRGTIQEKIFLSGNKHTFYTIYGDVFAQVCVIVILLLVVKQAMSNE